MFLYDIFEQLSVSHFSGKLSPSIPNTLAQWMALLYDRVTLILELL